MIVGRLVQEAATEIKERLKRETAPLRVEKSYIQPDSIHWDDNTYRGDAYPVYAWACTIADVEVDMTTGAVRVTDLVTAVDCGKALHPVMAEGQIEGGCLQAVGWATIEEIKIKDGGYQNDRLATYLIPTALDAPRIRTILVENPYSRGPFGAKGIGELPMDGPAPAIVAAIHDATGVWLDEFPPLRKRCSRHALHAKRHTGVARRRWYTPFARHIARGPPPHWYQGGLWEGECGACSVIIDGEVVDSCLVAVGQVEGCKVITVEGWLTADG